MNPNLGRFKSYSFGGGLGGPGQGGGSPFGGGSGGQRPGGRSGGGFSLGRWFGIPVELSFSVLILLVILLLGSGDAYSAPVSLMVALGVIASILAHEFGHALMARRYGLATHGISLHFFGGVAKVEQTRTPAEEFWIALAGPAVNLLLGAGLFLLAPLLGEEVGRGVLHLSILNGILALFNLVPGYPMDGGRMLRAFLWRKWRDPVKASVVAARGGEWVAISCLFVGLMGLVGVIPYGGFGLMLVGGFLWVLARLERLRAQLLGGVSSAGGVNISGMDIAEMLRRHTGAKGSGLGHGLGNRAEPTPSAPETPSSTESGGSSDTLQRGQVEVIVRDPDGREKTYRPPTDD